MDLQGTKIQHKQHLEAQNINEPLGSQVVYAAYRELTPSADQFSTQSVKAYGIYGDVGLSNFERWTYECALPPRGQNVIVDLKSCITQKASYDRK